MKRRMLPVRMRGGTVAGPDDDREVIAGPAASAGEGTVGAARDRIRGSGEAFVPCRIRAAFAYGKADDGAATAEFAVVLPAVVAMAALLLCLSRTVVVAMDCRDAAAVAARELVVSRGEGDPYAMARAVAGSDAEVTLDDDGERVTVIVHCPVIPDPLGVLPTKVTGKATGVIS